MTGFRTNNDHSVSHSQHKQRVLYITTGTKFQTRVDGFLERTYLHRLVGYIPIWVYLWKLITTDEQTTSY